MLKDDHNASGEGSSH